MTNHIEGLTTGFLRLASILAPRGPIPVSKSTWWAGVKSGRFPKPVKLGPRITAWRVEDIRQLGKSLGIRTAAEAIAIVSRYYPEGRKTRFGLEEMFGEPDRG